MKDFEALAKEFEKQWENADGYNCTICKKGHDMDHVQYGHAIKHFVKWLQKRVQE